MKDRTNELLLYHSNIQSNVHEAFYLYFEKKSVRLVGCHLAARYCIFNIGSQTVSIAANISLVLEDRHKIRL